MQFNYQGHSLKSGVYKLTNTTNGRVYIGSAKRFKERGRSHERELIAGKHGNQYLQNDFNKCGTDSFILEVLEVVEGTKEERVAREQFYIDQSYDNQNQCYNIRKDACYGREGVSAYNPAETANRIGKASRQAWSDPLTRAKHVASAKEHWNTPEGKQDASNRAKAIWSSVEHREAMSALMVERNQEPEYKATLQINLDKGRSKERYDKTKAAYREELTANRLVIEMKDYQGPKFNRTKLFEDAYLLSPDGVLYRNIYNLRQFGLEQGFNDSWKLQEVIDGKRVSVKGWIRHVPI